MAYAINPQTGKRFTIAERYIDSSKPPVYGWALSMRLLNNGKWGPWFPPGTHFEGSRNLDIYAPTPLFFRIRRHAEQYIRQHSTGRVRYKVRRYLINWREKK